MDNQTFKNNLIHITEIQKSQPERFNSRLDLRYIDSNADEKWSEIGFHAGEWARNPYGCVHGGIISSILDTAMGMSSVAITENNVNTVDISVSFLRPMTADDFVVKSKLNLVGRRMTRCVAEVFDAETGKVCATGSASFILLGKLEEK